MELIELHILQSFPVTCLNRDDVGAPKTAYFGGAQRARVSSQSWKRAIRAMASEVQPAIFAGTRTRFVIRDLKARFLEGGRPDNEAQALAECTADALGKIDNLDKGNVKTLLYFSPMEMQSVVQGVLESKIDEALSEYVNATSNFDTAKALEEKAAITKAEKALNTTKKAMLKLCEKPVKRLKSAVKDAADIAIFGRMVADDHSLMLEGAGLFSHAISTHRAFNEVEFFSAVDDRSEVGDEGAGHIGTLEFNSACYYRYVGINLDLLFDQDHLSHFSQDERHTVLDSFIRSAILAVPGARKNSMFGFNPPSFVLGIRRRGQPLSLVNSFEKPVKPSGNGYIEPSIEAVKIHLAALREAYGLPAEVEVCIPDTGIDKLISGLLGASDDMEA